MAPTVSSRAWSVGERISRHEFLIMLAWSLWLAFPYFGFGHQSYVLLHDCGDFPLPFAMIQASWLSHFKYWLWNLLPICGVDSLPSGQPPFKLDVLSFAVLPTWLAYGLMMWLQRFVAGYFMFRLAKDVLQLGQGPALFSGLFYALFRQGWLSGPEGGFALLDLLLLPAAPFVVWGLSRLDATRISRHAIAFALGALFSICSHYRYAVFFFPLLCFWFLVVTPRRDFRFWLMLFFFGTGYILTEAPIWWATYLYTPFSHRTQWTPLGANSFITLPIGIRSLAVSLVAMVRDNALPLFFLLTNFAILRRLPRQATSLIKLSVCIVAFQVIWPFILRMAQSSLGFLVGFNFSRFYLYLPFFLATCGTLSLNTIEGSWRLGLFRGTVAQQTWSLRNLLIFLSIAVLIIQSFMVQGGILLEAAEGNNFANFYHHRAFELLKTKKQDEEPFRVATVVQGYQNCPHPAFAWAYSLESVDGYLNLYSRRYQEYWGAVLAPLTATNNRVKSYFWSWGCRVYLFSPDFFEPAAPQASETRSLGFSDCYNLNLLALGNAKYIVSPIPLRHADLRVILSPTAEQILWKANPSRFDRVMGFLRGKSPGFALYVYENLLTLPRFSLKDTSLVFQTKKDLLEALSNADHNTLSSRAFVLSSDISGLPVQGLRGENGTVRIRDYSFDRISLATHCDAGSILVAANSWSPYWKAWVDGVETRVFPVNHTFQGVYCAPGSHEVVLRYLPPFSLHADFQ
jgi:hypothetical protein